MSRMSSCDQIAPLGTFGSNQYLTVLVSRRYRRLTRNFIHKGNYTIQYRMCDFRCESGCNFRRLQLIKFNMENQRALFSWNQAQSKGEFKLSDRMWVSTPAPLIPIKGHKWGRETEVSKRNKTHVYEQWEVSKWTKIHNVTITTKNWHKCAVQR